ncbi:MAG: 3-phosphoshikimate 1-carboxyvinyltransferase [Gammaproteobacteria bacterium]|nr:3-phosphoshikimate 1-carboxyvinyltransferase [Gammaproteobacteria bacterium]
MAGDLAFRVTPGGALVGTMRVPGDKSISHRAVILGAIAEGGTRIDGFLEGADTLATLAACRAMGVAIDGPKAGCVRIAGKGLRGLARPAAALDLGNSGTGMRLLAGVLAGQDFSARLVGDASLTRRPMARIIEPLARMGARIEASAGGTPPLTVHGAAGPLRAIRYRLPVASAQVKSCVLLAGLYADGTTVVSEPAPSRDHTERMLRGFGHPVRREGGDIAIDGGGRLVGTRIEVPGDISSAAFFLVGASIAAGSDLRIDNVGMNPTRTGVITLLEQMGARIEVLARREAAGEPVADLRVRAARLRGVRVDPALVPLAIDEFPALFVAAACAEGVTELAGARELRVKESDRLAVMAEGLARLGADARATEDGMVIRGGGRLGGGEVSSHGDHRVAMAFAMAGLAADGPIRVRDCDNVATSFPGFAELARGAGLALESAREA